MNIRKDFEFLKDNVYLDMAAGSLKPKQVIDAIANFYTVMPLNPHSLDSEIGANLGKKIDEIREKTAELINASSNEIIFTSGTTESLNMFASMSGDFLKKGDEIVLSVYNHISNIMPWEAIAETTGAKIVFSHDLFSDINSKTKIVAFAQQNNTIEQHIDIVKLHKEVKKVGGILVNDAAQAIAHTSVSLHDADVVVFSSNKVYGPTGIGVLAIRKELLSLLKPKKFGGGSVALWSSTKCIWKDGPASHEAGTPNTAGLIGFGAAIEYFNKIDGLEEYENELTTYAFDQLMTIDNIKMYSKRGDNNIIFNIGEFHSQDVVSYLGSKKIYLRTGEHCAKMLKEIMDYSSTIRLSIAPYNNKEDIDITVDAIKNGGDFIDYV